MWPSVAGVLAGLVALAVVWVLARGLTSPLREMVAATEAMARGDFSQRVTATSHDEIGTLARSFNQMAAELAETDRLRRDLVANVSHELRTPITALQAVLENIVDGVAPPDPETLRTMLAQVERLGRLVQQLLDLSRLESGTLPLDRRLFDDRADARARDPRVAAARGRRRTSRSRSCRATSRSKPTPSACTRWSRTSSRTRCATRRPTARCSCARSPTADGARLEVIDEGPGIPDAEAARVFERFYRADSARSSTRRRRRPRPRDRPLDRRAARRRDPRRAQRAARLPHGRDDPRPRRTARRQPRLPPTASPKDGDGVPDLHRRRAAPDPARRDGARGRRRGPRERGRPHARGRVGDARGDQLHAALGARPRVHAVRRRRGSTSSRSARWCRPAPPAATPRSP